MQTNAPTPREGVLPRIRSLLERITSFRVGAEMPASRTLQLRETIALDTRRRVHLIQCGDKQVLVMTGGTGDHVIGWVPHP